MILLIEALSQVERARWMILLDDVDVSDRCLGANDEAGWVDVTGSDGPERRRGDVDIFRDGVRQ